MQADESVQERSNVLTVISRVNDGSGVRLPVLEFFNDCMVIPRTINELTLSTTHSLTRNYHNHSLIVDRSGTGYLIGHAEKSKRTLLNLVLPAIGFVVVDLVVSEVIPNFSFLDLKALVIAEIARREAREGPWEDFRSVVVRCERFCELFPFLTEGIEPADGGRKLGERNCPGSQT
jgi:hypothetical protein